MDDHHEGRGGIFKVRPPNNGLGSMHNLHHTYQVVITCIANGTMIHIGY